MNAAHSRLGASSMYRWSACPGSVREIAKAPPTPPSSYALEGTQAHGLAAMCLLKPMNLGGFVNKAIEVDGKPVLVTQELAEAVQVYLDEVRGAMSSDDCVLLVEQRFDLSSMYPGCFGTADAVVWAPHDKTLHVFDYKHGAGIPVDPIGNPQLQYYGLGALLASSYPAKVVRLVIVQPRCGGEPVKEWRVDAMDLTEFAGALQEYAKAAEAPDAPLKAGDWCKFCPAAALCPELRKRSVALARSEFAVPAGPKSDYDPARLRLALDSREFVRAWLKALDEFAYTEAERGMTIPGYKLVAKRATRKWRTEGEVIEALQDLGVKDDVIFEARAVKSPAQLEKLVDKTVLEPFITAESSGHALVPESDKRPAVTLKTAAQEFDAIGPAAMDGAPVQLESGDLLAIPEFLQRKAGAKGKAANG